MFKYFETKDQECKLCSHVRWCTPPNLPCGKCRQERCKSKPRFGNLARWPHRIKTLNQMAEDVAQCGGLGSFPSPGEEYRFCANVLVTRKYYCFLQLKHFLLLFLLFFLLSLILPSSLPLYLPFQYFKLICSPLPSFYIYHVSLAASTDLPIL